MKHILSIILRVLVLAVIYTVLTTVGAGLVTPHAVVDMFTPEQAAALAALFPVVGGIMTVMFSYLALRSRWHGWRLAGALFTIYFVLQAFLGWVEVLAFPAVGNRMPPGMLNSMLTLALIVGIPFSLLTVWILGKTRPDPDDARLPRRLAMPASEWCWKLGAAAVLYVIVYFTFGYYVAWRTPGVPEFYGGTDPGTFIGQLANVLRDTPWLFPFQIMRGLIWAGVGLLIIAMHKGRTWEVALATGLIFTVVMNAGMLMPNPFFTPVVQRAHSIELLTSNLLYGILLCLLMTWKPRHRESTAKHQTATVQ
jgi:hypothetical protein